MQECAKKQSSLDFLTPRESRMRQRHCKIKARYDELKALMSDLPDVKVYAGKQALDEIVELDN